MLKECSVRMPNSIYVKLKNYQKNNMCGEFLAFPGIGKKLINRRQLYKSTGVKGVLTNSLVKNNCFTTPGF